MKKVKVRGTNLGGNISDCLSIYHTSVTGSNLLTNSASRDDILTGVDIEVPDTASYYYVVDREPSGPCEEVSGSVEAPYTMNTRFFTVGAQGSGSVEILAPVAAGPVTGNTNLTQAVNYGTSTVFTIRANPATSNIFSGWQSKRCGGIYLSGNATDNIYKTSHPGTCEFFAFFTKVETWCAGGALLTGRYGIAGVGTQCATMNFGGYWTGFRTCVENYNGTIWSAGTAMTVERWSHGGAGTPSSALAFGGDGVLPISSGCWTQYCTQAFNGSSWSSCTALNNPRYEIAGFGAQDAALAVGGIYFCDAGGGTVCSHILNNVEKFNGTTWTTESSTISTCTYSLAGVGQVDAGLIFGGIAGGCTTSSVSSYDGYTWSTRSPQLTDRGRLGGAGTSTLALSFGGAYFSGGLSYARCTEEFNGTTWSSGKSLITARAWIGGSGIQSAALSFGGVNGLQCTEHYNKDVPPVIRAWTVSNSLTTARFGLVGIGTSQNAGLSFGGTDIANNPVFCTEEYNGMSWTNIAGGGTARSYLAGTGTQSAGLALGGYTGANTPTTCTEEYDGSTWSSGGALNIAAFGHAAAGTQTATVTWGGYSCYYPGYVSIDCAQSYDGSTWSTLSAGLVVGFPTGTGVQNAALSLGGTSGTYQCSAWLFNGTSWSILANMSIPKISSAAAGTFNAAMVFGGIGNDGIMSCTEEFNGITWSSGDALNTARGYLGGAGTLAAGLSFGGCTGNVSAVTEEYN